MKLLVALCLVTVVAAAPPSTYYSNNDVRILKYDNDLLPGGYNYIYEQTNGQKAQETGRLKNQGQEDETLTVSGVYSWVGPDGVTYTVTYTADEEGYKPEIEQGPGGSLSPAVLASLVG